MKDFSQWANGPQTMEEALSFIKILSEELRIVTKQNQKMLDYMMAKMKEYFEMRRRLTGMMLASMEEGDYELALQLSYIVNLVDYLNDDEDDEEGE